MLSVDKQKTLKGDEMNLWSRTQSML